MNTEESEFREEAYREYPRFCGRELPSGSPRERPYFRRLVRRQFPADRMTSVVDLGCGDGALLAEALRAGYTNLRGVDRSLQQVEAAQLRGIAMVVQADLLAYVERLEPQSVGVIVTLDVLEHLTRREATFLARGVARALRPGGRWIVHVPNGESPFFGRIRYGDITHETAFTTSSLGQLFRMADFERFAFFEDAPVVHGPASLLRRVAWRVMRTGFRLALLVETGNPGGNAIFSQGLLAVAERT